MKKLSALSLLFVMTLAWLAPRANAQEYEITLPTDISDWHKLFTNPDRFYLQAAVIDDHFYTVPAVHNSSQMVLTYYTIGYDFSQDVNPRTFSCGSGDTYGSYGTGTHYFYAGPQIAADSEGTLWTTGYPSTATPANAPDNWSGWRSQMQYWRKGNLPNSSTADRLGLNLGSYKISGRSDLMTAYGNCLSGTGYFWFCINEGSTIERVTMQGGVANANTKFTAPTGMPAFNSRSTCTQYASNKVCLSPGVQYASATNNRKVYKGVINGSSISWTDLGVTSYSPTATMIEFCGQEILVYASSPTEFCIRNVTTGKDIARITPWGSANTSDSPWVNFSFNMKVDGKTAYIYIFTPGIGAARYSLIATPKSVPVTNLNVTLVEDDDPNYIGRQNAEIVWSANPGWSTQPTSYKVEYKYTYNLGNGELSSSWYSAGTTTTLPTVDNPFVHVNIHYYKSGVKNVPRTYIYRVTPIFGDVEGVVSDESVGITPKYIPIAPRWIYLFGEETYQGLCMTQLYWDCPSYGLQPDSYDIYRDGQKITGEEHVAAFVKVDYNAKANTTHQYEITTYYNGLDNSAPARSSVKTVTIGSRDWSKPKYTITEIYNFDLDDKHMQYEIADGVCGEYAPFYKANIYTQGTFRDGKWYVAQRFNGHVAEGSVTKDIADAGTSTGGIIVFDADAQAQSNGKMVGGKLLSLNTPIRHNQTRGVAVDDAGNVFVRGVGAYNSTDWCYIYEYQYPLTDGVVYKPEANGTYTAYTVDFVGAGIDLEEQQQAYTNDYTMGGRVDYFSMSGDVFSTEGGYLYVAPSQGRAVYVINLKAGSGTTLKATLVGVYHENGTTQKTQTTSGPQPYKSANENYAFPVNCEGRNGHQFVFNLRSNLYRNLVIDNTVGRVTHEGTLNDRDGNTIAGSPYSLNVKGVEGYAPATPTVNAEGRIYDFHSRVNNSGGATFEFNGELFIVTPISQYSINTGSFYVGRGFRKTVSIDPITGVATRVSAKDADLCNIIPVATVYQSDDADASNTTASGMWCYGEVPDYDAEVARVGLDNADKDGDGKIDYAYIYIFAPGNRFAKYRIDPDGLFPPSPNEIKIVPEYERDYVDGEHNAGGELLKYDAVVEWDAIENAYNTDGTGNYSVESYTITLCYEDGTPVTDENGNPLTVTIPVYNPVTGESSEYVVLDDEGNVINYTYTFPDVDLYDEDGNVITYVSQVVVNYRGVDGTAAQGKTQTSVKTEDENHNDYDAVAPGGEVRVGVAEDWADWDGDHNKSKDDGYWNRYTVELHPTNPEWGQDQREEPVSYYTITVSSGDSETNDADKGNKQICDFYLYDPDSDAETEGVQNVTGLTPDENGYVHITDCKIPGDYVFTPDDNIPDVYWFEVDYTGGTQGTAAELEDGKINPEEWTYTITAEYAASNTKISKSASGDMENNGGVTTRVEVINVKSALSIYPIPATSSITVKASEAINTIAIYSMAGVQVKAVACEGENVVVVSVEDLAAGQYMVKVNNFEPVKIVKQ
jgi:hypothetical protein